MKLKCLIVDDEPLALDLLEEHISVFKELELAGRCDNAITANRLLRENRIDLLFLDIQMPVLSGIEFIRTLSYRPKIVFTTAYKQYAFDAFELDVDDYLLKPITFDRFFKTMNKIMRRQPVLLTTPPKDIQPFEDAFVYLKAGKKSVKVTLSDINFIESKKDYVRIQTQDKEMLVHHRISELEDKLPAHSFLRIHRSFIISRSKILSYSYNHIEISDQKIPIGRNYREKTLNMLNEKLL